MIQVESVRFQVKSYNLIVKVILQANLIIAQSK